MFTRKYKNNRKHKRSALLPLSLAGIILVIIAVGGFLFLRQKSALQLPEGVSFGVWYPSSNKDHVLKENTLQYDQPTGTITFKLTNKKDNNELTFVEQAVPESFAVAPEAFDKQVTGMQQVTRFDSVNGQVAITRPFENGQQTAIMRSQGTIVYITSQNKIEVDNWRVIFNDMDLQR